MTPDDLDTKSLEELDEIFAVEVAGKHLFTDSPHGKYWEENGGSVVYYIADQGFSTSADAVLPWLEKHSWTVPWTGGQEKGSITVMIYDPACRGTAPTFPHAAVKALIRAERAKKQSNA